MAIFIYYDFTSQANQRLAVIGGFADVSCDFVWTC